MSTAEYQRDWRRRQKEAAIAAGKPIRKPGRPAKIAAIVAAVIADAPEEAFLDAADDPLKMKPRRVAVGRILGKTMKALQDQGDKGDLIEDATEIQSAIREQMGMDIPVTPQEEARRLAKAHQDQRDGWLRKLNGSKEKK